MRRWRVTGCWWHWTPEWKTCRTLWSRTKLLKKKLSLHIFVCFPPAAEAVEGHQTPFTTWGLPPEFLKNHFTERKATLCENTAQETHNRAKKTPWEVKEDLQEKLTNPNQQEGGKGKEGRNEKPRIAKRDKKKKLKKEISVQVRTCKSCICKRQKKPQGTDN